MGKSKGNVPLKVKEKRAPKKFEQPIKKERGPSVTAQSRPTGKPKPDAVAIASGTRVKRGRSSSDPSPVKDKPNKQRHTETQK